MVHEAWNCGMHSLREAPPPIALGHTWEVCAMSGGELHVQVPLINLIWHSEQGPLQVSGCIKLTAPAKLPELGAVRGTLKEQTNAIAARAKAMGGCPVWNSLQDRILRGADFTQEYGFFFGVAASHYMQEMSRTAMEWTVAPPRAGKPGIRQVAISLGLILTGGNEAFHSFMGKASCGEPTVPPIPMMGIGVYRHQEVVQLVTDPKQPRTHLAGGRLSDICFDPTMSIFLSTGTPEHTQARRLWDIAGLASAHVADLPPVDSIKPSWRRHILDAMGLEAPARSEVDMMVVSCFMEALWRKKPTLDQSHLFVDYLTFGTLCIQGQLVEKLPIIPSRLAMIRREVVNFARDSPLGKAVAELVIQPEYAELRELYESRGHTAVDVALLNLADATMYFGLIGTARMTAQCISNVWTRPRHANAFRQNATTYLWELMRISPGIVGSYTVLKHPWRLHSAGEYIEVPPGSAILVGTSASGFDTSIFKNPHEFNPNRSNLGEVMTWNGKLQHVTARDYNSAPRFCPGQALSVRLASHICGHVTQKVS